MSDFDPLRQTFAAYRNNLSTEIEAAGPAAARTTVRRRRRIAAATGAVLAVALVVAPIAAQAALDRDSRPPGPADSVGPTYSPTPEPGPTATLSPSPAPASSTRAAPNGRITRAQLLAARVDLPPWPPVVPPSCAVNDVRLRAAPSVDDVPVLLDLEYGDIDRDGADETLALVECRIGEATAKQAVVFDRTRDRRINSLGQVARTNEGFDDITGMSVEGDGDVRLQVADIQPCCRTPAYWARHQWRTYGWNGERFTQMDGPTAWGPDPRLTDLTMTAGTLVLGPADSTGTRPGSVTFTVKNTGPVDVAKLGFAYLGTIGTPNGGDWSMCREPEPDGSGTSCLMPGLRVGERRTYTFRFLVGPSTPGPTGQIPSMAARVIHYDADNRYWQDLTPKDNSVTIRAGN